nr:truncated envelope glycoprotein [Human immunodeficiency virus 1]
MRVKEKYQHLWR